MEKRLATSWECHIVSLLAMTLLQKSFAEYPVACHGELHYCVFIKIASPLTSNRALITSVV